MYHRASNTPSDLGIDPGHRSNAHPNTKSETQPVACEYAPMRIVGARCTGRRMSTAGRGKPEGGEMEPSDIRTKGDAPTTPNVLENGQRRMTDGPRHEIMTRRREGTVVFTAVSSVAMGETSGAA